MHAWFHRDSWSQPIPVWAVTPVVQCHLINADTSFHQTHWNWHIWCVYVNLGNPNIIQKYSNELPHTYVTRKFHILWVVTEKSMLLTQKKWSETFRFSSHSGSDSGNIWVLNAKICDGHLVWILGPNFEVGKKSLKLISDSMCKI